MEAFVKTVSQAWVYANSGAVALGILIMLLKLVPSDLENAIDPLLDTCFYRRGKLLQNLLGFYAQHVAGEAQALDTDLVMSYLRDCDRYGEYRGELVRLRSLAVFSARAVPVAAMIAVLALLVAGIWESSRPAMAVLGVFAVIAQPAALVAAIHTKLRIHRLRTHADFSEIATL